MSLITIIPKSFWILLCKLISKLLDKNYSSRATVSYIKETQWFKKLNNVYGGLNDSNADGARKEKVKVMQKMVELGFSVEAIKESLERRKLNHVHACYKLLMHNI